MPDYRLLGWLATTILLAIYQAGIYAGYSADFVGANRLCIWSASTLLAQVASLLSSVDNVLGSICVLLLTIPVLAGKAVLCSIVLVTVFYVVDVLLLRRLMDWLDSLPLDALSRPLLAWLRGPSAVAKLLLLLLRYWKRSIISGFTVLRRLCRRLYGSRVGMMLLRPLLNELRASTVNVMVVRPLLNWLKDLFVGPEPPQQDPLQQDPPQQEQEQQDSEQDRRNRAIFRRQYERLFREEAELERNYLRFPHDYVGRRYADPPRGRGLT